MWFHFFSPHLYNDFLHTVCVVSLKAFGRQKCKLSFLLINSHFHFLLWIQAEIIQTDLAVLIGSHHSASLWSLCRSLPADKEESKNNQDGALRLASYCSLWPQCPLRVCSRTRGCCSCSVGLFSLEDWQLVPLLYSGSSFSLYWLRYLVWYEVCHMAFPGGLLEMQTSRPN